jgi:TetR/AcrR family transcriptional repressor of nem operon
MARPREFDEKAVLEAAVRRFWARGYEATSVRDLSEHMGITVASLYNAFGDKRGLYRQALDYYVDMTFRDRVNRFENKLPPHEAIRAFFNEIVDRSLNDEERHGCMLVNSALEVAPHDPEFQRIIAKVLAEMEAFFLRCVQAGQKAGTVSSLQPAPDLAKLLLSTFLGIRVLARARPQKDLFDGMIRPVFALLGLPEEERQNVA